MKANKMTPLLYFTAIGLSAISAYYSIAGLVAIFAAAVIPVRLMGGALEFAKLVIASWLYRSWKFVPVFMKCYFTFALIILMCLTSMGIFGFLSKAHLDQGVPTADISAKVSILDEKIKTEKDNIEANRAALKQLDAQVNETLSRTTDDKGTERSVQIRRAQSKERASLLKGIETSQNVIAKLNEERAPIASEMRKVEAEVGPIKYIAALIYGDTLDQTLLEKAVRIVIILIVTVFDPLAVLLLMAANTKIIEEEKEDGNKEDNREQERTEEESSTSEPIRPNDSDGATELPVTNEEKQQSSDTIISKISPTNWHKRLGIDNIIIDWSNKKNT